MKEMNSLQEKFNKWRDARGDAMSFYANNGLLGNKDEETRQELEKNYQKHVCCKTRGERKMKDKYLILIVEENALKVSENRSGNFLFDKTGVETQLNRSISEDTPVRVFRVEEVGIERRIIDKSSII